VVRGQVLAEREGKVWPGFDQEVVFELGLDRCLLMLTQPEGAFPAGPTIWKATGTRDAGGRGTLRYGYLTVAWACGVSGPREGRG
jgi:hypothetical protein